MSHNSQSHDHIVIREEEQSKIAGYSTLSLLVIIDLVAKGFS